MHFQQPSSSGSPIPQTTSKTLTPTSPKSSSLPFGHPPSLPSISGPTYLTAQTLIQQLSFTLSDKIFAYSPSTFDLSLLLPLWQHAGEKNGWGYTTDIQSLETRVGAGASALGYIFSRDFEVAKRHIPQTIVASSGSLGCLRRAVDQWSCLYGVANPLVAHVAAVDYSAAGKKGLVTDYVEAMGMAEEIGLGLVGSKSPFEVQHMGLFATLLAKVLPTLHLYDGVSVGRETCRIVDVLDQKGLFRQFERIGKEMEGVEGRHLDGEGRVVRLLKAFNEELGTDYGLFEYQGHAQPENVLVVFGTVEASLSAQVANALAKTGEKVGVVNVRVYRPFVEELFLEALPDSVQNVAVLGQVKDKTAVADTHEHSRLYTDVLAALSFSGSKQTVMDVKYAREQVWTPRNITAVFRQVGQKSSAVIEALEAADEEAEVDILDDSVQQYTFWSSDESASARVPVVLGQLLSGDSSTNVSVRTGHDNLVQSGIVRTDIRSSNKSIEAAYSVDAADVAVVTEEKILGEFEILDSVKAGGVLVVKLPGVKDEDLEKKLPIHIRKGLVAKKIQLYVLDPTASAKVAQEPELETYLTQLAFLGVAREDVLTAGQQKLAAINGITNVLEELTADLDKALRQIAVPEEWAITEEEAETAPLPVDLSVNSFTAFEKIEPEPPTLLKKWTVAAKGLAFREAYGTQTSLRPDLGIKTHVVKVQERRRLTPLTYDRNIFHIEFDLGDSGLKYAIGEALGIHAENDKLEVEEFIKWYGLDPEEIVEVPTRDDPNILENRTVYQSLLQNVDIFGRPPKRFYEALADFADDPKEKQNLLTLSTPDGATEFKRRAEVDTVTYADILLEFPSAHPSFHDIVRIVAPMKRREYSIASSQHVTPTSVALQKIYIQDRMRETMREIREAYFREGGSFYLCGPTWPVPDVTEVLMEAWVVEERSKGGEGEGRKVKKGEERRAVEALKEEGRFVLEVY
ncbi:sulfite reductase flavo protein component [Aulographum hederae CBS 113979]|uniref:assimilatory sulfite reductase (NADPH) n=1 Tax=Aulographum hederae CBS 113979 TaxID=1176131 RepID=A0A6G1GVN3_9PEZI|nr:sulfite reductase flavo protein component [Aulographum hederae CBS 113979]